MFDFIGDIHGYADALETLLVKLGYSVKNGSYSHPERKVLFVGDYIDRGPRIRDTLLIIRAMVENDQAIALMGNHEYNALCFHYPEYEGGHLRKHLIKNIMQHYETLKQFQNKQKEYEDFLDWFKTLPLFYEDDNFRAVHAMWNKDHIEFLRKHLVNERFTDELLYKSVKKDTQFYAAVEETLKGKEIPIPYNIRFTDKEGISRSEMRIKWWEDPLTTSYRAISVEPIPMLPETSAGTHELRSFSYYPRDEKPVFFGHYWLKGDPSLYHNNICCLDYSVARQGKLVAYRYDGEALLDQQKMVFV